MNTEIRKLLEDLEDTFGPADNGEYKFLGLLYEMVRTAPSIKEAEDRLREAKRFASSMWGMVKGRQEFLHPKKNK